MIINPSDKDFKETKLIKRGKRKMNSDFLLLAEWINATFNVFVINIFYDTIDKTDYRPRLTIIFELVWPPIVRTHLVTVEQN